MSRYVCIHGHFYQPPREDPWRESVERQPSANPFHDWNERISEECYAPNGAARILDGGGKVARIYNNYARMSFNFGPTLLSWLQTHSPHVYARVLAADKRSISLFGRGSAMAQGYSHQILPLASRRDKETQVRWGLQDFEHRFGRRAEGMWLPETAADVESLEVLAQQDVRFTILAPGQAMRVRPVGTKTWIDVQGGNVNPRRPYLVDVGGGRLITVFFYDHRVAHSVAFNRLLEHSDKFEAGLIQAFDRKDEEAQLVHIATDGESYGHHHRHGEMALAHTLARLETRDDVQLTNYASFLEKVTPSWEAEIVEPSSWSCAHGVERWSSACGCGGEGGATLEWRSPLRSGLDALRRELDRHYEERSKGILKDPWRARDEYIEVVLDRQGEGAAGFFRYHLNPDPEVQVLARRLLEMQRHAMLMYTSCAWFFEELSRPEPIQVLRYAARAIHLAEETGASGLRDLIRVHLEKAPSNSPQYDSGAQLWDDTVEPRRVELADVVAHYGASCVFMPEHASRLYGFSIAPHDVVRKKRGRRTLALGRAEVTSLSTGYQSSFMFAFLHLGDHNLTGGVVPCENGLYEAMRDAVLDPFQMADVASTMRAIDSQFQGARYSLDSLFPDEQREVLSQLVDQAFEETTSLSARLFEKHEGLLRYVIGHGHALPQTLQVAADFLLNARLASVLGDESADFDRVRTLVSQAKGAGVNLDAKLLAHGFEQTLNRLCRRWARSYSDEHVLAAMVRMAKTVRLLPFPINLFVAQNTAWQAGRRRACGELEEPGPRWSEQLDELALHLGMALPKDQTFEN